MKHRWHHELVMRRWLNDNHWRTPLPKANPTIERWHWPVLIIGVN